jgi:hypothetical protein
MDNKKPDLIIIGGEEVGKSIALELAIAKLDNPNYAIVTLDEAKEKNLIDIIPDLKIKPIMPPPELPEMTLKENFYSSGKSARNIRREQERKNKKKNRK